MNIKTKSDIIEMLVAKNIMYIALGFAAVGILSTFGVDFMVSIGITLTLIVLNNRLHCKQYWSEIITK